MKILRNIVSLLAILGAGCGGDVQLTGSDGGGGNTICPPGKLKCIGDVEKGTAICTCEDVEWFCEKNPHKCTRDAPLPASGGGSWSCTWSELKYTCTKAHTPGEPLPGGNEWTCTEDEGSWTCTKTSDTPDGSMNWSCTVAGGKLVCLEEGTGGGTWNCSKDTEGNQTCTKDDLPTGGAGWKCHQTSKDGKTIWVCVGQSSSPPGGSGWNCAKMEHEPDSWRCEKPVDDDLPPGGGEWGCVMGSEVGGTQCTEIPPKPNPGQECVQGEKMWCDGLVYCAWGLVSCDAATGKWKRKKDKSGKLILDCMEPSDGRRPNTVCACYFFFYNPDCCERPDCLVPAGSQGQICPTSAGELCDHCNPITPECKGSGSKCVIAPKTHETFCGTACSSTKPCPMGYKCEQTPVAGSGTSYQCLPADLSCYY